ncbi:4'-phosphopantetheinyl transferase family protein [Dyella choica]|uniref:4'-phosphopantetheinyl transferase superfamily protein n=1 Tax=Dyella choica TaxID=1927959 RepID=A0A432M829_9GAMM|nr:4'-phosphopantetheinyl transferase superfamily protein [Dyella choica]RUL77677.1 4'-phosphopantetheinyl transferase superfamily protein [Dyella choica]
MNGATGVQELTPAVRTGCRLTVIHAMPADLWQEARRLCDDALARGSSFVAILRGADAFGDESLLVDADRQRASRFRLAGDRHNFVLGRTLVHHLVRPCGAPVPYAFSLGRHGKPFLPDAPAYNVSHSGRWLACAVSSGEPIGIDIETFARLGDYRDLLPAITHAAERRHIEQAPAEDRQALFKRCWTRKEAVLKAIGTGLSDKLQAIDVCLDHDEPVLSHPARLRLIDLPMGKEPVTAALAQAPSMPGIVMMLVLADT